MKKIIIAVILCISMAASVFAVPAETYHYSFDNDAVDNTGSLNLTEVNGVAYSTDAVEGSHSASFDNVNDYFETNSFPNGYESITFSAWIKPSNDIGYLLGQGGVTLGEDIQFWLPDTNRMDFVVYKNPEDVDQITSVNLPANFMSEWTHIAISISDGNNGTMYVNGLPASSYVKRDTTDFLPWTNQVRIGARVDPAILLPYGGLMDDVRIWLNTTVTDQDILDVYNENAPNNCPLPGQHGYWPLDEGTGTTTADAVGSNNGTITGATWTTGNVGNALSFDGSNDGVSLGDIEMDSWTGLTVSAWAKTSSTTGQQRVVVKDQVGTPGNFILWYAQNQGGWEFLAYDGVANGWSRALHTSTAENDGNWHHFVGVVDPATDKVRLYVDGVEQATADFDAATLDDSDNEEVVIGADSHVGSYEHVFDGEIDEVSIFDRALSAAEVNETYQAGLNQENVCTVECVDNDGDGFGLFCTLGLDCDDSDATKQPPVDATSYTSDVTFCPGTYSLPSGITAGGVDLNFGDNGDVTFS